MTIIDQLKRDEGLRLKPYRDSVGKLTIGIGRNLDDVGISEAEAEYMLGNDVYKARQEMLKYLPWTGELDDVRFGALLNMAFNMGVAKLLTFRNMLAAAERGDWSTAAGEGRNSTWHSQVGERAERLMRQLETGVWQ